MAALGAALLAACAPSAADAPIPEQWRSVVLEVTPVELGAERVGSLVFRGGVSLASADPHFGGLSGLEVMEDGRLIAISDDGAWFSARLELDEEGALVGVGEGRIASMRDETGQPFVSKEAGDAEDIAQLPDGRFAVSFEQTQTIRIYDLNRDGPFGAAVRGPLLGDVNQLPSNAGLEAIVATADGDLVVGAEGGTLWSASFDTDGPTPPIAIYPLELGFGLTALDRLPDGDFIAIERFYAPLIGAQARIARVSAASLGSRNALARVTELALLRAPLLVDNFEAVSVARAPDGGVRLYILSDDNFSARQRTLLYAFDVEGGD